jgi:hypothetical protein
MGGITFAGILLRHLADFFFKRHALEQRRYTLLEPAVIGC